MHFDEDPEPVFLYTDGLDLLSDDERMVGLAHLTLMPILQALQAHPFNPGALAAMREYLDSQADEAHAAFHRLCALGPRHLLARLAELDPWGEEDS